MRITITTDQARAIKLGRNSESWTTDVDPTAISPQQRETLAEMLGGYDSKRLAIVDATGEITATSIQQYIDTTEAERVLHAETVRVENEKNITEWLAKTDEDKIGIDYHRKTYDYHGDNSLPSDDPRVKTERARLQKICDAKNEQKKNDDEKYEADKIARETATEARKFCQLTDAVTRLGTKTQSDRWNAGVMARSEAIDLLWHEMVAPLTAAGFEPLKNEYHITEKTDEGDEIECSEGDKKTLTDEEFVAAKKATALIPSSTAAYYHQYQDGVDEPETCDLVRLTKTIGEYTLECDVVLSS